MTNKIKNICVFASSSNHLEQSFYNDARELGLLIGQNGFNIVYGGSKLGMMFACAGAVKESGGKIIGIMPEKLANLGCANPDDCDEFILTSGMRERKAKLEQAKQEKAERIAASKAAKSASAAATASALRVAKASAFATSSE